MKEVKRLPVTMITGFLGSGKTTVLNQMIRQLSSERIMVIENEVGQTNIDGALVEPGIEDVIELTAGCLCCSLSDELLEALEVVSAKQDLTDRLVIETTGVADPSSIVQVFMCDPMVGRFFELQQVIAVVDAGLVEDWLNETDEALRQIVMADVILINKADTVSDHYLQEVVERMKRINPYSHVISGEHGQFAFDEIWDVRPSHNTTIEEKLKSLGVEDGPEMRRSPNANKHKVTTFTLTFDGEFVLDEHFSVQLHRLVSIYRDQVYRIKGILNVKNYPNRVILQSVRTSCVVTDGTPWSPGEARVSKLVFIGRGLKREAFEKMFNRFTRQESHESI